MKITILIDNTPSKNPNLYSEHGLSIFVETDTLKFLCDTGASDKFMANAETLGIDLGTVDFTVISHGHNDHSGGLVPFIEKYAQIPTFISAKVRHTHYFSARHEKKKDISTDEKIFSGDFEHLSFLEKSCRYNEKVAFVYTDEHRFSMPFGDKYLTKQENDATETADDFTHELSVAVNTDKGLVIIAPCSHNGAVNIIEACRNFTGVDKVYAYIGGLHFVESERTIAETANFKQEICSNYPDIKIFTGHCTCDLAKREIIDSITNSEIFRTGTVIEL